MSGGPDRPVAALPPPDPGGRVSGPDPGRPATRRRPPHRRSKQIVAAGAVTTGSLLAGWFAVTSADASAPDGDAPATTADRDATGDGAVESGRGAERVGGSTASARPSEPDGPAASTSHGS